MEGQKHILILLMVVTFFTENAYGSWKSDIYQAYIGNKMNQWQKIIDKMEQEKIYETDFLLQLVNYQYGYIGWCIGVDKTKTAQKYLEFAEKNLHILSEKSASASTIHAYKSAFYGFKIGLGRIKAPFYGPKSVNHAKDAIKLDKNNPFGYIQYGNIQFYMPAVFGGSKDEAINYFQKAEKLMEQDAGALKNDWNYLSLLVLIAQSLETVEQYKKADEYYRKILKAEPDFLWVKNELYPDFKRKYSNYINE